MAAFNPQLAGLLRGDPSLQNTLEGTDVRNSAEGRVANIFEQLRSQISEASTPATIPVPQAPGAVESFAAQLAANLGSSLLQDPNIARATSEQIQSLQAAPASARAFNVEQRNQAARTRIIQETQLSLRRLDAAIGAARDANDFDNELKLLDRKNKLEENLIKKQQEFEEAQNQADRDARIKVSEIAARSREETAQIAADASEVRAMLSGSKQDEGEPLNSSQFLTNLRQVAAKFPGAKHQEVFGIEIPGSKIPGVPVTLKITPQGANALVSVLIVGVNNGDQFVAPTAFRMLERFLREQEGITNEDEIFQRMTELGVNPDLISVEDVPDQ